MREISLDTETTGLSYTDGDRITEIGCVEIIDKIITGNTFHTYINPERELSPDAERITGLTYEKLKEFGKFADIYQDFLNFVKDDRLVIHNAKFDIGFLNYELGLVGATQFSMDNVIDTLDMARKKYPGSPATLDALCKKFTIDSSIRSKHGALIDADLLAQVYVIMSVERIQKNIFGSKLNDMELVPTERAKINYALFDNRSLSVISEVELARHAELISKIKNPIWYKY